MITVLSLFFAFASAFAAGYFHATDRANARVTALRLSFAERSNDEWRAAYDRGFCDAVNTVFQEVPELQLDVAEMTRRFERERRGKLQ
jgi:hypothetical protein